jgi:isochorismate synthase
LLASYSDLNGREGFVFAPFHITDAHPLLLIQPHALLSGWKDIHSFISTWENVQETGEEGHQPTAVAIAGKAAYLSAFDRFLTELQSGQFGKLVLSRCAAEPRGKDFSVAESFVRACETYKNTFVYLFSSPVSGTWMGSSPEVLLQGRQGEYQTVALAGTRKAKPEHPGVTRWDVKNKSEQLFVADYLRDVLIRNAESWSSEKTETITAGNVVHLKTGFRFVYSNTHRLGSLLQQLHPTPAVCWLPKEEAFRFILDQEGYDREYYSGFAGYISAERQTDLYVNLRCMKIESGQLKLFAGGGLLPSSYRETEWRETEEKLKTMRRIIGK